MRLRPGFPRFLSLTWGLLTAVALLAPFLTGNEPLVVIRDKGFAMPLLRKRLAGWGLASAPEKPAAWREAESNDTLLVVWPPVPYEPLQPDYSAFLQAPLSVSGPSSPLHVLGTDALGRDVLAGLLHATHHTLLVAFSAMALSFLVGTVLGASAGFWGNTGLRLSWPAMLLLPIYVVAGWFWAFSVREPALQRAMSQGGGHLLVQALFSLSLWGAISLMLTLLTQRLVRKLAPKARQLCVPLDDLIIKMIEILSVLPRLLILMALVPFFQAGWGWVILILGLLSWTGIARLWRNNILSFRSRDYVLAAKALGLRQSYVLLRHILPNASGPVAVAAANGLAGIVLSEAALSFLGFGLPQETLTWGRMLMSARFHPDAWWLTLFPALCLAGFIALCNETARLLERNTT